MPRFVPINRFETLKTIDWEGNGHGCKYSKQVRIPGIQYIGKIDRCLYH